MFEGAIATRLASTPVLLQMAFIIKTAGSALTPELMRIGSRGTKMRRQNLLDDTESDPLAEQAFEAFATFATVVSGKCFQMTGLMPLRVA
jgi:hypothetical protein